MLEIKNFKKLEEFSDSKFEKVNPFSRQCIVLYLIVNNNGKMEKMASFTVGYPKQFKTGFETFYCLLTVYHNHEVFWSFSNASGCGYNKKTSAINKAFFKMFETTETKGREFSEYTLLEAIAKFFGYDNFLIV